ncbi:MAG: hypothetical protein OHK0029_19450 [Armatimonadaceae bacterium]
MRKRTRSSNTNNRMRHTRVLLGAVGMAGAMALAAAPSWAQVEPARPGAVPMWLKPGAIPMNPRPGAIYPHLNNTNTNVNRVPAGGQVWIYPGYPAPCPPLWNTGGPVVQWQQQTTITPGGSSTTTTTTYGFGLPAFPPAPGAVIISPLGSPGNAPVLPQHTIAPTVPVGAARGGGIVPGQPNGMHNGYGGGSVNPVLADATGAVKVGETAALRTALNSIAVAWTRRDANFLGAHLDSGLSVAVFEGNDYRRTLSPREARAVLAGWMDRAQSSGYRFFDVRRDPRNDGLLYAYATQEFRLPGEARRRTATARYTLTYLDGAWRIAAISLPEGLLSDAGRSFE